MSVYPITDKVKEELVEFVTNPAIESMINALGEYEHGTADVEGVFDDIFREHADEIKRREDYGELCLKLYAAALQDLALTIFYDTEE